jgi:hypothetical protein
VGSSHKVNKRNAMKSTGGLVRVTELLVLMLLKKVVVQGSQLTWSSVDVTCKR